MFATARRGRYRALVTADDGSAVAVGLRRCEVLRAPHASGGGGTYATLRVPDGETRLATIDAAIRGFEPGLAFSPLRAGGTEAVVKLARGLAWPAGAAAVDARLSPGPFGAWGYCLTATRVEPAAADDGTAEE